MSTAYKELVERAGRAAICSQMPNGAPLWVLLADNDKTLTDVLPCIRAAFAVVLRTLETVTPAMEQAWLEETSDSQEPGPEWRAMLRASPLAPPKP